MMMRPTMVEIENTEAGEAIGYRGETMGFEDFEARALKAAMGHTTGGYLKTWIVVHLTDPTLPGTGARTYGLRLDLGAGPSLEKGFADAIGKRIKHYESAAGRAQREDMPKDHREDLDAAYGQWVRMDFRPSWWIWEIEDLSRPVGWQFCTLPHPFDTAPAVDFEAHKHPVRAVACPDCQQPAGSMCKRPSGHGAPDFHKARKERADALFIEQHGEDAWIERLPGDKWKVHATGAAEEAARQDAAPAFATEMTPEGEQYVIPGCERPAPAEARQGSLF